MSVEEELVQAKKAQEQDLAALSSVDGDVDGNELRAWLKALSDSAKEEELECDHAERGGEYT